MRNRDKKKAIGIVVLLILSLIVIQTKGKVSTDLSVFLPEASTKAENLLHYQLDKGASSNLIFIALTGLPTDELVEVNQRMTDKLRQSDLFSKVTNSADQYGVDDLSVLEIYRYLLSRHELEFQFSTAGFEKSLNDRLEGLASATSAVEKRYLRQDPTGEVIHLLGEWQGKLSRHKTPEQVKGIWFSEDHHRSLILAEIEADISDLDNQVNAVVETRKIFDQVKTPSVEMIMTGPAAFAVESGEDIREDVRWLTSLAVFFVVLFLGSVYRSLLSVALVVSPLIVGVVIATASILLLYGQIHGITLAFGITLAGVAVDYSIHLLTGMSADRASTRSHVVKIWRTLRLGVLSTIIAYTAFLLSGFGGLQQLGLFTIVGLTTAALFSRWVLPILVTRARTTEQGLVRVHNVFKSLGQKASASRWLVAGAVTVALTTLVMTDRPLLHLDVDSLSPIKDSRRAEGELLRGDLGFWFGGSMLVVTASDKEAVLQKTEDIEDALDNLVEDGQIDSYDMAAHFLPSQARQALKQQQVLDTETIRANLESALKHFPFRETVFDPFFDGLAKTGELALLTPEMLVETPVGRKLEPLLFDFGHEAGGVILLHGVSDRQAMLRFAENHENVLFLHLKSAATDLVARSVDRVSVIMIGCIVLIYGCLALAFRSLVRPLKIMIPTLSAAVVVATVLIVFDQPLSIFHLISLLLVVGLGLDYALFFNRLPENALEWDTTFKSLWICGVTTILVFGILMFSRTPPLEAIGVTVGIGSLMSIVFAAMWATTPEKMKSI